MLPPTVPVRPLLVWGSLGQREAWGNHGLWYLILQGTSLPKTIKQENIPKDMVQRPPTAKAKTSAVNPGGALGAKTRIPQTICGTDSCYLSSFKPRSQMGVFSSLLELVPPFWVVLKGNQNRKPPKIMFGGFEKRRLAQMSIQPQRHPPKTPSVNPGGT